jgi:hypothetical protein
MSPNQALLAIGADAPQPKRQRWGNNKNRMKSNRFKWTLVSIAAFILIGAGIFCYVLKTMRAHSRILSCNNHERFLLVELQNYGDINNGTMPYDQGVSGFEFIARFSASSDAHVNCNHGSQARIGGWQAVNLTPQLWSEVAKRWDFPKKPIPFAWCGKATGVGQRVVTAVINYRLDAGFVLHPFNMNEAELKADLLKLNEILISVGEAPIEMNVPDCVFRSNRPPIPILAGH